MRRLSPSFLVFVFAGCQFSASCGQKNLNLENGREFLMTTLERELGQKPTAITCPDKVAIKKDATFECTASFGTANAKVGIVMTDDQGGVSIQSITGVLIASKLEAQIADHFGKKLNAHITVACGERVRNSVAGEKFTCDAKDAKGNSGKVTVDVQDTNGKVNFAMVPAEAPPAPAAPVTP